MTKPNVRLFLLAGAAVTGLAASAQTATHHTASTVHHTAAAHPAAKSDCVVVPTLPSTIPALPVGIPCPKSMVTISEGIQFSPLVGPELRGAFPNLPSTFTLAYQDLHLGTGDLARSHMYYTVKYTGYLTDGTKFDSSFDHPETAPGFAFPYGGHRVIPGWDMGFEGMHLGGKRRLYIPYQLAYGSSGRPPKIPAKSELIFDMELVSQSATDPNAPPTPPAPPSSPVTPGQPASPPLPGSLPATPPTGTTPGSAPSTSPQTVPPASTAPTSPATPTTPSTPVTPTTPHPGL